MLENKLRKPFPVSQCRKMPQIGPLKRKTLLPVWKHQKPEYFFCHDFRNCETNDEDLFRNFFFIKLFPVKKFRSLTFMRTLKRPKRSPCIYLFGTVRLPKILFFDQLLQWRFSPDYRTPTERSIFYRISAGLSTLLASQLWLPKGTTFSYRRF